MTASTPCFVGRVFDTSTDTDTTLPIIGSTTTVFGCLMLKFWPVFVAPLPGLGLEALRTPRVKGAGGEEHIE